MISKKEIKTYMPFALNVIQRNLSYKANAVIFVVGEALMLAVSYFLWKAIYASSPEPIINGFNFNEMVIYVLMSFLTGLLVNTDISYDISSEVKDGSIAMNLIRPINYERRMMFQGFGNAIYNFSIIFIWGAIGVTILLLKSNMTLSPLAILGYFISVICGLVINFYYSYIFGLLAFKLTNMWGLSQVMNAIIQLLSGLLIPITFFPIWAQKLINLTPFSSMIYTPTMIYLGKITGVEMWSSIFIQLIWVFILLFIARMMWKKLIKHLVILGG